MPRPGEDHSNVGGAAQFNNRTRPAFPDPSRFPVEDRSDVGGVAQFNNRTRPAFPGPSRFPGPRPAFPDLPRSEPLPEVTGYSSPRPEHRFGAGRSVSRIRCRKAKSVPPKALRENVGSAPKPNDPQTTVGTWKMEAESKRKEYQRG